MIGGEPMPDRPQLAETIRVPMVAVPVELLERCLYRIRQFHEHAFGQHTVAVTKRDLARLDCDLQDALAAQ